MNAHEVAETWRRIDAWLDARYPRLADAWAPPVDIAPLEGELGVALPLDVRASFAIHGGGRTMATAGGGLYSLSPFYDLRLLGPGVVIARHAWLCRSYAHLPSSEWARIDDGVARAYFDPRWIPTQRIVEMITNNVDRRAPWPSFGAMLVECVLEPIERGDPVDEDLLDETGMIRFTSREEAARTSD